MVLIIRLHSLRETYADPANPTVAEIQSVINSVNAANVASSTALGEVIEDIAGNTNGITVSATQLNEIAGVTGAENGANYTASACSRHVCRPCKSNSC